MRKVIFSLMAIVAVLFTAMSFTSCEKDEETKIQVTWAMEVYTAVDTPAEVLNEIAVVDQKMDKRTREIFGTEPFYLEADAEKARPTNKALESTYSRFGNDGQIVSCMKELKAINTKYGKNYADAVGFGLLCGSTLVGACEFDPNDY